MAGKAVLSLKDVATKLRVHPATIMRWLETGRVAVKKKKTSRGHYVFTSSDLRKLERFRFAIRTVA